MEQAEWGRHRPPSVSPEPPPAPEGPSLLSMSIDEETVPKKPVAKSAAKPGAKQTTKKSVPVTSVAESGDTSQSGQTRIFKVVMLGDSGVGKTTFIQQFCKGEVSHDVRTTVGIDYFSKTLVVDGQETSLKIWDTAGTERYRSISSSFLRGADGIILLYDVANKASFQNVHSWVGDIQEKSGQSAVILIAGNKTDKLSDGSSKRVSFKDGQEVAESYKARFAEVSSLTGHGVQEAGLLLVRALHSFEDKRLTEARRVAVILAEGGCVEDSFIFDEGTPPKKSGCC